MKNETDRSKSSKLHLLKKKSPSLELTSEEPEKKSRKGKKPKKTEENAGKKTSFVRKFTFGKYMTSQQLPRASSSKSVESDNSDRLSSGYSTLTPTSLQRTESEETPSDTCSMEGASSSQTSSKPPVSATPYSISSWNPTSQSELHEKGFMTENNQNSEPPLEEDEEKVSGTVKIEEDTENIQEGIVKEESEKADPATEAMPAFGNLVMDLVKDQPDITSNISQSGAERKEHLYKILVIGELGTGKTSIIKRYVHQFFSQHYRATIGVDFALKVLNWDANTIIRLQLWDIAGQERFGNMTRVYYKDAVGAFIVFDVTRVATFDAVDKWKQDLDSKVQLPDGSSIPCVLLGNKCDQQKEGIVNTPSRMDEYCKERGFSGWFETSAKENVNIEEAARFLVNKILLNDKLLHGSETNKDNDRIAIDDKRDANGHHLRNSKTCSC